MLHLQIPESRLISISALWYKELSFQRKSVPRIKKLLTNLRAGLYIFYAIFKNYTYSWGTTKLWKIEGGKWITQLTGDMFWAFCYPCLCSKCPKIALHNLWDSWEILLTRFTAWSRQLQDTNRVTWYNEDTRAK